MAYERAQLLIAGPPSRKRPRPGDVFTLQLARGLLHGLVASTTVPWPDPSVRPGCLMVLVHRQLASTVSPIPRFTCDQLLLPPIITNRQGWLKGYFQTVAHDADVPNCPCSFFLPHHGGTWLDKNGQRLAGPVGDVGRWELGSYSAIGHMAQAALVDDLPWPPGSSRPGVVHFVRSRKDQER